MARHIALIGMMGSGKSTVAPLVANALGRQVIEVDAIIEKQEEMPIGEIFIAKGEAYFRRVESELIARLLVPMGGNSAVAPGPFRGFLPLGDARNPGRTVAGGHGIAASSQCSGH
jgi:shikimate kinase